MYCVSIEWHVQTANVNYSFSLLANTWLQYSKKRIFHACAEPPPPNRFKQFLAHSVVSWTWSILQKLTSIGPGVQFGDIRKCMFPFESEVVHNTVCSDAALTVWPTRPPYNSPWYHWIYDQYETQATPPAISICCDVIFLLSTTNIGYSIFAGAVFSSWRKSVTSASSCMIGRIVHVISWPPAMRVKCWKWIIITNNYTES